MRTLSTLLALVMGLTLLALPATAIEEAVLAAGDATGTDGDSDAAPVTEDITWYLHAIESVGEANALGSTPRMQTAEPSADESSMGITNYLGGPNPNCSGSGLLPTWQGFLTKGGRMHDVAVTLDVAGIPESQVVVNFYESSPGGCNENASPAIASRTFDLPAGRETVTLEMGLSFDRVVKGSIVMMLHAPPLDPSQGRVFFDGAGVSQVTFRCEVPDDETTCGAF